MQRLAFDFAPWRLSGQVVGVLLNHRPALAALGGAAHAAPYKAPPKAPVLYLKPRNTQVAAGSRVIVPAGVAALEVGAALGLVVGRTACAVAVADAMSHVAGVLPVADLSVPHANYYRPSVRHKARDGFCPLGPAVLPLAEAGHVDALTVEVRVGGVVVQSADTGDRLRTAAQLIADISAFMTLAPGDVVLTGIAHGAPQVEPGRAVEVRIGALPPLCFSLTTEVQAEPGGTGP